MNNWLPSNRLGAGSLVGIAGIALITLTAFFSLNTLCFGLLIVAAMGIACGMLIARNPAYIQRGSRAGALAGLVAGTLYFLGQIIVNVVVLANQPADSAQFFAVKGTVGAWATATVEAGGAYPDVETLTRVSLGGAGILSLLTVVVIGGIVGEVARRNHVVAAGPYVFPIPIVKDDHPTAD